MVLSHALPGCHVRAQNRQGGPRQACRTDEPIFSHPFHIALAEVRMIRKTSPKRKQYTSRANVFRSRLSRKQTKLPVEGTCDLRLSTSLRPPLMTVTTKSSLVLYTRSNILYKASDVSCHKQKPRRLGITSSKMYCKKFPIEPCDEFRHGQGTLAGREISLKMAHNISPSHSHRRCRRRFKSWTTNIRMNPT